VRILDGAQRVAAAVALAAIGVVGVFSAWFLLVPLVAAALSVAFGTRAGRVPA
jgi:hypothetical protein